MIYLVLNVDPFGIPLREKGGFPSVRWPVSLSEGTLKAIVSWNDRFSDLISAEDRYDALELNSLKQSLNSEGRVLAKRIGDELSGEAKVEFLPE